MSPREIQKKVQLCLYRTIAGISPSTLTGYDIPFPKVDSFLKYICGLFSNPRMGNLLHMVEFSTLGMVLLDGIPSEGLKASCFLCAHSATRKLMYPGLPRRDYNVGSFIIAASLNTVSLRLSPWHELQTLHFEWLANLHNLEKVWVTVLTHFRIYQKLSGAFPVCSNGWENLFSSPSKTRVYLKNFSPTGTFPILNFLLS